MAEERFEYFAKFEALSCCHDIEAVWGLLKHKLLSLIETDVPGNLLPKNNRNNRPWVKK